MLVKLRDVDDAAPRDIGHLVSPDTKMKFDNLAANLVRVRKATLDTLGSAGAGAARKGARAQRRPSGTVFDLGEWRLDDTGALVRREDFVEDRIPTLDETDTPPLVAEPTAKSNPFSLRRMSASKSTSLPENSLELMRKRANSNPFLLDTDSNELLGSRGRSATMSAGVDPTNPFSDADSDGSSPSSESRRKSNPFSPIRVDDGSPAPRKKNPFAPHLDGSFVEDDEMTDDEEDAAALAALQAVLGFPSSDET
jgi:hypothetical protein